MESESRHLAVLHSSGQCLLSLRVSGKREVDLASLVAFVTSLHSYDQYVAGFRRNAFDSAGAPQQAGPGSKQAAAQAQAPYSAGGNVDGGAQPSGAETRQALLQQRLFGHASEEEDEGYKLLDSPRAECGFVRVHDEQLAYRILGSEETGAGLFTLALLGPCSDGEDLARRQLFDVQSLLELLFGASERWRRSTLAMTGVEAALQRVIMGVLQRPTELIGGVPFVLRTSTACEKLDQLLGALENDEVTQSSLLLLRDAVLHSRMAPEETRLVRELLALMPLEPPKTYRATPVFISGQWKSLVAFRMRWYTLCLLVAIECPLQQLLPKLEAFQLRLETRVARLQLPISRNYLTVGDFSDIGVLAFVFHDASTGHTLAPVLRKDPSEQVHGEVLTWMMRQSMESLQTARVGQLQLLKGGFRFFASTESGFGIYVLAGASQMGAQELEDEADRLVTRIRLEFVL